ncbi:MAG: holA [Sphingomonas bacterium]|jgi:DNA polymerase-3 subunit delta|nr:holA [Sphingomonas bacterium]MDB5717426.1 holA [Sphingomonas bacterium]
MKANRAQMERALDEAKDTVRLFLLYGPDEATSRDLSGRLAKALGADAERTDLTGAALKADPARLADEAASISLFGGRRYIRVESAGDDVLAAVEALMEAPAAGNPVAIIAGALRKDSKLVKLAESHPAALALNSYMPEGQAADRLAMTIGRDLGLTLRPDVAHRIAVGTGADRALMARELEKLALYVDAAPDRPAELDHAALDALSAEVDEGDLGPLVDAVLGGRPKDLDQELARLGASGVAPIPILRALLRRLHLLADIRSAVAGGNSVEAAVESAGRAVFWKDKPAISSQVARWQPQAIDRAVHRLLEAERAVKRSGAIGTVAVTEELLAIARAAARMR